MNLLIINPWETLAAGGVNKVIKETAKNLSKLGHNVTVLQTNPFNLQREEMYDHFKILRVNSKIGKYTYDFCPEMYFYLKKNFKKLKPEIVHLHGYHNLFSCEILFILRKILKYNSPIILSPHFGVDSHDKLAGKYLWDFYNNHLGKKMMKIPDKIISSSNFELENIKKFLDVPNTKLVNIPHGIDMIDITKKTRENKIKLLYAGYLLKLKGVNYVIEAVYELIQRNVEVKLTIIGEGPYKESLMKLAKKLKVENFIQWKDFIPPSEFEALLKYYKDSDIFLLLSMSENYGSVVPEALAMGTPVIVTEKAALKEFLIERGCFGVDYPPDPEKIADLIIEIYDNDVKVGPLSKKIKTWDNVTEKYEKVYLGLIKENV